MKVHVDKSTDKFQIYDYALEQINIAAWKLNIGSTDYVRAENFPLVVHVFHLKVEDIQHQL